MTCNVWAWIDGETPTGEPVLRKTLATGAERPANVPAHAWLAEQDVDAWRQEIMAEFETLDRKSIRALRDGSADVIAAIEARAAELRGILMALPNA